MPVSDLERFLASEKHLPNVPAASEIKEKGLSLSEFQMKLLEKIEELTLYAVQQHQAGEAKNARISALEGKNNTLETRNSALEARLAAIEQMLARQQEQQQK